MYSFGQGFYARFVFCLLAFISAVFIPSKVHATDKYVIDPQKSKVSCLIKYVLIGKYQAEFRDVTGEVIIDDSETLSGYVSIFVGANSIISDHPELDKIAKSGLLLNTEEYPEITYRAGFRSVDDSGYEAKGDLRACGNTNVLSFPFHSFEIVDNHDGTKVLKAGGRCSINRKDYDIMWNKYLDKGGVIVADRVVIDWKVWAEKINPLPEQVSQPSGAVYSE